MTLSHGLRLALLAALLGSACATPPPPAALQEAPPASLPALQKRISFDKDGTLPELLDHLRTLTGANLFLNPGLLKEFQEAGALNRRRLVLHDVSGESALRWIIALGASGLEVAVRDGVAVIDSRQHLRPPGLRLHDLRGIRPHPADVDGGNLALGPPGSSGLLLTSVEAPESSIGEEMIIDLIKENVRPGTWEGEQTIEHAEGDRLLVNASAEIHDEVAWLLDALRSFSPATVSLSADIVDGDAGALPGVYSPAEAEAVARKLRAAGGGSRSEITGLEAARFSARRTRTSAGLLSYQANGDPLLGTWTGDASILDIRPTLIDGGRNIIVELRLALGRTRDLAPVSTPAGTLPLKEIGVTRLGTTCRIPNGGAVLFALPSKQLCLLRASSENYKVRQPAVRALRPPPRELFDRLQDAPAVDVDFKNSPLSQVVAWLRTTTGLNWILNPELEQQTVTLRCTKVPVAGILPFLLKPLDLDYAARDEALFIAPKAFFRHENETCLIDLRQTVGNPWDFPGTPDREQRQSYTGEDIANLIKNTIHKDRWEEADGHSIQYINGILIIRNAPDMIRECLAFVEGERTRKRRTVSFRATLATLPADALPEGTPFIDAAKADAVAGERLAWQAQEAQRTTLNWDRALDYVEDVEDKGTTVGSFHTTSHLEVSAAHEEGGGVFLHLRVRDQRVPEVREAQAGGRTLQQPILESHEAETSLSLPAGKAAVFRWALPGKGDVRVLLLQAAPIP